MQLHRVADRPDFRAALERHLEEYGKTRGAVSELAGSFRAIQVFKFNTDESQCLHWLGSQPAASRRNVGMARPPQ